MLNCIYDIFLTCEKNECPDLVVMALPMFLSDAHANTRKYVADETDIGKWHARVAELDAIEGALNEKTNEVSEFIGRHYDALVAAFKAHDRAAFDAVVEACVAEDKAAAEAAEGEQDEA